MQTICCAAFWVFCCQGQPLGDDSIQAGPQWPRKSDSQLGSWLKGRLCIEIWDVPGQA